MKKILTTMAIAAAMFAFAACSSPTSKAISYCEDLLEATKSGDLEKAAAIEAEAEAWMEGLSEEEAAEVEKAVAEWARDNMEDLF